MILKHKPESDISVSAYLNILYISHHELQQSMFLKSHLQKEIVGQIWPPGKSFLTPVITED